MKTGGIVFFSWNAGLMGVHTSVNVPEISCSCISRLCSSTFRKIGFLKAMSVLIQYLFPVPLFHPRTLRTGSRWSCRGRAGWWGTGSRRWPPGSVGCCLSSGWSPPWGSLWQGRRRRAPHPCPGSDSSPLCSSHCRTGHLTPLLHYQQDDLRFMEEV